MDNENERLMKFEKRRDELKSFTDEQLKRKFWELCRKAVEPMIEMARSNTSPSIERSVLLRMGIDSVTAKCVVSRIHEAGLLGKGAGNVLLKVAKNREIDIVSASKIVLEDKNSLEGLFGGNKQ